MATALFTRWFQTQVFSPDFRTSFLPSPGRPAPHEGQLILHEYLRLRQRFECYVDSVASMHARGAASLSYAAFLRSAGKVPAYAFGPSLWICPAPVDPREDWPVTLPAGTRWFDFWTGASFAGGEILRLPNSPDRLAIFVKAGSILPLAALGTDGQVMADGHEIRVYPGSDGCFTWHEKGSPALSLAWDDKQHSLKVTGAAAGKCRDFEAVVVRPGRGVGLRPATRPDATVRFDGRAQTIRTPFPPGRPAAPKGLLIRVEGRVAHACWQEPCAGVFYRLKQAGRPGKCTEDIASVLDVPEHTFEIPNFEDTFHCFVTAMNAGGESDPSPAVPVSAIRPRAPRSTSLPNMLRVV